MTKIKSLKVFVFSEKILNNRILKQKQINLLNVIKLIIAIQKKLKRKPIFCVMMIKKYY